MPAVAPVGSDFEPITVPIGSDFEPERPVIGNDFEPIQQQPLAQVIKPDSVTPKTDQVVAATINASDQHEKLLAMGVGADSPQDSYNPADHPVAEKVANSVVKYVKGMIPTDRESLMHAAGIPVDWTNPTQVAEFVLPIIKPSVDTAQTAAARTQQIQESFKTPAGSQERYDALIGAGLDAAQLAGLIFGARAGFKAGRIEPEVSPRTAPEAGGATSTLPEVETKLQDATASVEGRSSASLETPTPQEKITPQGQVEPSVIASEAQPVPEVSQAPSESVSGAEAQPSEPVGIEAAIAEIQRRNAPEPVQHGEFGKEGYTAIDPVVSDELHVSSIANRFVKERATKGEVGEIAPGQGYSTTDLVERGLKMSPEEVDQHVSDLMQDTGDIVKQGQAVRAEEARLSQRSNELSRAADKAGAGVETKLAADNAFKDLTDFHNGPVAKLKQKWHATGIEMQGEVPVDLSTFNGLREQFLRDTGKAPSPKIEPQLRRTARNVAESVESENAARSRLAQEIEKTTARRKFPTADEVRNNIRERMGLGPCEI